MFKIPFKVGSIPIKTTTIAAKNGFHKTKQKRTEANTFFKRYLHTSKSNNFQTHMKDFSYITHSHPAYIESLYNDYVQNPDSVDPEYRKFFEGFDFAIANGTNGHAVEKESTPAGAATVDGGKIAKEL